MILLLKACILLSSSLCCRRDGGSTFHAFQAALGNLRRFQEALRAGWSCWSWCRWRAIEDRRVRGFGAATKSLLRILLYLIIRAVITSLPAHTHKRTWTRNYAHMYNVQSQTCTYRTIFPYKWLSGLHGRERQQHVFCGLQPPSPSPLPRRYWYML